MNTRVLSFEGCFNFRDLGGYRTNDGRVVRSGRVFRSDSVHLMTEADAARARNELGLRTLIDLRNEIEIQSGGIGVLAHGGVNRLHLNLTSRRRGTAVLDGTAAASSPDRSPDTMVAQYLAILEVSSESIVAAVDALGNGENLPAVFFCAAGKDRTGVLSAVVLGSLGVRDADIVEDYVLTADSIERIIERFAATPGSPTMYRDIEWSNFAPLHETMERVIEDVRQKYGSFDGYLIEKGLAETTLERFKSALLDA